MAKKEKVSFNKRSCSVTPVDEHLKKLLKDRYFREQYELDQQKLKLVKPIISYRIKHKLNQGQFAREIGVSQQHISKIENGEFSSISTLYKVLRFIGYTLNISVIPLAKREHAAV